MGEVVRMVVAYASGEAEVCEAPSRAEAISQLGKLLRHWKHKGKDRLLSIVFI